jgi:hypothetical protein
MLATKAARSSAVSVATAVPLIPIAGMSSSPAIGCVGRPQPRSSNADAAAMIAVSLFALLHDVRQLRDSRGSVLARKLSYHHARERSTSTINRSRQLTRTK